MNDEEDDMNSPADDMQVAIKAEIERRGLMITLLDIRHVIATLRNGYVESEGPLDQTARLWHEVCRLLDQAIDGPARELDTNTYHLPGRKPLPKDCRECDWFCKGSGCQTWMQTGEGVRTCSATEHHVGCSKRNQ